MSAAKKLLDHKLLRSLSPLCDLSPDMLAELIAKSRLEEVASGVTIFTIGERDHRTLYLIAGKLELTDASGRTTKLAANTKQTRLPLDQEKPRTVTAVAIGPVTLLNIDTSLLDMLVNWGSSQTYEVSNLEVSEEEETDWMSRFLQSRVFLKLRAENIQAMMMRMEEVAVRANDVIIKQGDVDENYYINAKGKAKVARRVAPDAPLMKLAVLTAGSGFGEEALIANSERNASVVMIEDGKLMRLSKEDFINLLITPVLQYVTYDEAKAMGATDIEWLDVRKLDEFSRGSLPGAKNTPVTELRLGLRKLNKLHKYIVFSDTDDRAASAVFLLNQNGLDAYVLKDGLAKVPEFSQQTTQTPAQKQQQAPSVDVDDDGPITDVSKWQKNSVVKMPANTQAAAKQRVEEEIKRTQAVDLARKQASEEVARLKAEVEASRKRMEEEAKRVAKKAETEAEKASAEKRAKAVAEERAKSEEALKRAEAEAAKAKMAAVAKQNAENEIERLKQEAIKSRQESEEQARLIAANAKKEAEAEIIRLKAEAAVAMESAASQAKLAADLARSEAERNLAQQQAQESSRYHKEMEGALQRAEVEAMRAEQSETARRAAEKVAEEMRDKAAKTQQEMEQQTRLAADQARSEAERKAAQQRAEELAEKQQEIENAMSAAESQSARAQAAESEVERLRSQADEARLQAESQARLAADAARSEAEREMAAQRSQDMARLQEEREALAARAEGEADRARAAEEARLQAEAEIQRLKVEAEVARMQLEEQAQRVADAARGETEREAARARIAEDARLQAESELERLAAEVAQIRLEVKAQANLATDKGRTDAEREEAYVQAEVLAEQQKQTEAIARHAEEEAERAQMADEARQRAENEIARREQEAAEAARRAEEEAQRAQEAADAHRKLEKELAQLRAEAKEAQSLEAEMERQREDEAKTAEADEIARKAAEEAEQARVDAEKMRQQAEEDIKRLKAQAEAARIQAEIEVKRSIAAARREVDPNAIKKKVLAKMQAKADLAAGPKGNSPSEVAQRTRAARAAREAALESLNNDEGDDLESFFGNDVVAPDSDANSASEKAKRARAARAKALESLGGDDDVASIKPPKIEAAENDEVDNITDNDNLIDPTEVMSIDVADQKRHWDSDDHAWEAAVGHRKDPNIERYDGNLPKGLGDVQLKSDVLTSKVETAPPEEKTAENIVIDNDTPKFEVQEVNRRIRPQVVKPTGKPVRESGKGKLVIGSLVVIVAVVAGGWFYSQNESAPKELKQVVNVSTESLVELTDISTESLIKLKEKITETIKQIGEGEAGGKKPLGEEDMVKLRERLKEMKAESERATKKLAKQREVKNKKDEPQTKPTVAAEPVITEPAEVIMPVEPILTPPENNAPKARVTDEQLGAPSGENNSVSDVGEAAVVESVEGLPIIDTEDTSGSREVSETIPATATETAPVAAPETATE